MKKTENKKKNFITANFSIAGNYIKEKYPFLLLLFFGFLIIAGINLLKVSTSNSVAGFDLQDFEIGMIADRTIIAERTLPPDAIDTVTVMKGEKVIKKGFPVTEEGYAKLRKMSLSSVVIDYRAFANNVLYLFLIAVAWYLLYSFLKFGRKIKLREPLLQVILFLILYSTATFSSRFSFFANPFSICIIIPVGLCVMLITILYGELSAIIFAFISGLSIIVACGWTLPPALFVLASSLCAVSIVRKIERRLDLVFASIILSIFDVIMMLFLIIIFNEDITNKGYIFVGIFLNGFLSGILTLGFLTPLEYMLNSASVFRLMDLSDLNNPLMQKMLITASGTYNHSLMVAQLAESGCREIGANPLIARVGAYYHDIGKVDQSEYFVENQTGTNKHDDINPTLSASIIKSHVKKGVEKARSLHLPQVIIDVISEHHGNSVIAYFYNEAKEKDPSLTPEDFSYPGNPPSSKESAVVMLADTVEAACRTLENPSVSRLEKFITQLVNAKMEHKQLDNCDLTFKDVTKIKQAFVQILVGYYHSRIEYPDQQDPDKAAEKKDEK